MFMLLAQSALLIFLGKLFIREDFRGIARESIAANTPVCYVVPAGEGTRWASIMAFYVIRLQHRPDLEPRTVARTDLADSRATAGCRLWAEAHPEGRASDLASLPQFQRCPPIALGTARSPSASVLLSCPN
jgi:hypothetical protein